MFDAPPAGESAALDCETTGLDVRHDRCSISSAAGRSSATTSSSTIDLRFATIMHDLELPQREAHHALNDAVMVALAFVKLRDCRPVR